MRCLGTGRLIQEKKRKTDGLKVKETRNHKEGGRKINEWGENDEMEDMFSSERATRVVEVRGEWRDRGCV